MKSQFDSIKTEIWPLSIYALELMGQHDRLLNVRRMSGPGYVWMHEGRPVAAAGLARLCERQFFAWLIMAEEVKANKLMMCKLSRLVERYLVDMYRAVDATNIEAETSDEPGYCEWLERFGFKRVPVARYRWAEGNI